ncbi:MAG: hypothetical protein OCD03_02415 [Hyphomicrobiales bacterium]
MKYWSTLKIYYLLILLVSGTVVSSTMAEPMPTVEENHEWQVGGISIFATLIRPESPGKYPAIVFIAGSGPTDRDWNSPALQGSNGSAKLLANRLAELGMVTIRYDKRLSGIHMMENAKKLAGKISMQGHVDELSGAYQVLKKHPNVDDNKILVLANSEGVLHALKYQTSHDKEQRFSALILTGILGRPISELLKSQLAPQIESFPNNGELKAKIFTAIDALRDGKKAIDLEGIPDAFKNVLLSFLKEENQPFIQEFLGADPIDTFSKVFEPMLVMIGKKDIQVKWDIDGKLLENAVSRKQNVVFSYPENANHVLKYYKKPIEESSPMDLMSGYNGEGTILDPEAWRVIVNWIKQT